MPLIEPVEYSADQFPPRSAIGNEVAIRLESGGAVGEWNRWTYAAESPLMLIRCDPLNQVTSLYSAGGLMRQWADPLEAIAWMENLRSAAPSDGPPFKGGWIGYFGYDCGRLFETLPRAAVEDLHLPLFQFTYHDQFFALDRRTMQSYRVSTPRFPGTEAIATDRGGDIDSDIGIGIGIGDGRFTCNFTKRSYESAVERAIEYIAAGDIFQVNLSQRFSAPLREPTHQVYHRLQKQSPARHGAYLGYGDFVLLCNSPELFLRVTPDREFGRRKIVTRPIKGTRPNKPGMDEELRKSAKDTAELNMIIDLERNDLGRICESGSVKVAEPRMIESHPTVYHGAATVEGTLRDDVTLVDLLRATFPGGSITGAPKIRAMQIIDELEPTRRGPYCGAIGFISSDGHIEFNIAIRTMIATAGRIHIPVGGAIVADSTPTGEYEETLVKARAMFEALGLSSDDIH